MYEQHLIKIVDDHVREDVLHRANKAKSWKYGYDEKHDMVVISKTGQIGDVVEIQNLKIALPKPVDVKKLKDNKWEAVDPPKELAKIASIFEWQKYPRAFKEKYLPFIDSEFNRRENGFWFYNTDEKIPTYITGAHYMYLQWSKIDIGKPHYRESNKIFFWFWEACIADNRCYGMCYVKNRRSGFSFMSSAMAVNKATITSKSKIGILSMTGADAKSMFVNKVVPISVNYPFFFKPIQAGMDKPKTELAYRVPASKISKKSLTLKSDEKIMQGLDTTLDWKNTGDNSYDGEKLLRLIHDESGKWIKPNNILNNWKVAKTCLRLGSRIIGKCMMGSTVNSSDKGGENFKIIYDGSDVSKRNSNGQTRSGLYSLFIPMEWNYEGFIDAYGFPVFDTPTKDTYDPYGDPIVKDVIEHWQNEVASLKEHPDELNEYYRQFPRTVEHAFRDEAKRALYNLEKIYSQIDYNESLKYSGLVTQGNFSWENGIRDTRVIFEPSKNGRFYITWVPSRDMQNNVVIRNGFKYPGNEHVGAFGCDSYDISGTVDGRGSKGALHGLTKFNMENAPSNMFVLEYISRPQTAEIFFEDVLMAIHFYGMPILIENNKPRLLYHLKRRGYRAFSINRPDKTLNKLSPTEREIGGVPNSSEDMKQSHSAAIETYINDHVGALNDGEMGSMYFNRTLKDWSRFDLQNRTKFDASISSGLAIMACNRHLYKPTVTRDTLSINFGFSKYDNNGMKSKIINNG